MEKSLRRSKVIGVFVLLCLQVSYALGCVTQRQSTSLASDNASITTTRIFEENERQVKDIYYRTLARGNFDLSASEISTLYNIAIQCSLAGGASVYWARNMYRLVDEELYYNDADVCEAQGLQYRQASTQPSEDLSSISVHPNPAKDKIYIQTHQNEVYKFELYNVLGRRDMEITMTDNESISVAQLTSGMYFYRIILMSGEIVTGKVIIQH